MGDGQILGLEIEFQPEVFRGLKTLPRGLPAILKKNVGWRVDRLRPHTPCATTGYLLHLHPSSSYSLLVFPYVSYVIRRRGLLVKNWQRIRYFREENRFMVNVLDPRVQTKKYYGLRTEHAKMVNYVVDYLAKKDPKGERHFNDFAFRDDELESTYGFSRLRDVMKTLCNIKVLVPFNNGYRSPQVADDLKNKMRLRGLPEEVIEKVTPRSKTYSVNMDLLHIYCYALGIDDSGIKYKQMRRVSYAAEHKYEQPLFRVFKGKEKAKMEQYTDEELVKMIGETYPQVFDYENKIAYINRRYLEQIGSNIRFRPSITREDKKIRIGIRATNALCGKKSFYKHPDMEFFDSREQILNDQFGTWTQYDVHSSIPRLLHYLWTGGIAGLDTDCYWEMFGSSFDSYDDYLTNRPLVKFSFMLLFFNTSAGEALQSFFDKNEIEDRYQDFPQFFYKDSEGIHVKQSQRYYLKGLYEEWFEKVNDYCGTNGLRLSEIFLHESCIYIDVLLELLSRGLKVYTVFDAFYFEDGKVPEDIEDIIKDCIYAYFEKYSNNIHKS